MNCALCRAIRDTAGESGQGEIENAHLLETARFVVMPCIGPLVPGHVLVVSREHTLNLSAMGDAAIAEYDALSLVLMSKPFFAELGSLEGEHGSTLNDKAGACVTHTHIHWIPGLGQHGGLFDQELSVIASGHRLADLKDVKLPYILLRAGPAHPWRAYDARGLRSQMIRNRLCEVLGRDDVNWKAAPRFDLIKETVELWKRTKS